MIALVQPERIWLWPWSYEADQWSGGPRAWAGAKPALRPCHRSGVRENRHLRRAGARRGRRLGWGRAGHRFFNLFFTHPHTFEMIPGWLDCGCSTTVELVIVVVLSLVLGLSAGLSEPLSTC